MAFPLLHGEGGLRLGWHDWPWFAGFVVLVALLWWAIRRLGRAT